MCGIYGTIGLSGRPIDLKMLARCTDALSHRGPDARGFLLADSKTGRAEFFEDGPPGDSESSATIGLGHRRLSIIDLATGKQPMCNEDGSVWIAFNGEIYNFRELRSELEARGHRFRTDHSDTEVIIHAYEEWGVDCLQRFNGMWAFGIVDLKRRELFLARDRLGKKPLYYYRDRDRLLFASELKAIVEDPTVSREIDLGALADYLSYGYVPAPRTIYKHISKLKHRHCMTVDLHSARSASFAQKEYWDLRFDPDDARPESQWIEELHATLEDAIRIRMISDVALGAFLSGGVDSSTIVALMSRQQSQPVKTFAIGFEEDRYNELPFAREIAKRYGTEHHEQIVRADAIELLPKLARQYDEPFGDSSAIPTYYVSELARQHVTVALSGDAGDEVFAGYNRYERAIKYERIAGLVPPVVRRFLFGGLASLLPQATKAKHAAALLSQRSLEERYAQMMRAPEWMPLLRPELAACASENPFFSESFAKVEDQPPVTRLQYVDMNSYLPEGILVKVDRASMLHSLEVRVPLLDYRILELAAKIPARLKMNGYDKKYILKQTMRDELGADFLNRRKRGFSVPLGRWFRENLKRHTHERLLAKGSFIADYVPRGSVENLLENHQRGLRDFGSIIWRLLFLEHWGDTYRRPPS